MVVFNVEIVELELREDLGVDYLLEDCVDAVFVAVIEAFVRVLVDDYHIFDGHFVEV